MQGCIFRSLLHCRFRRVVQCEPVFRDRPSAICAKAGKPVVPTTPSPTALPLGMPPAEQVDPANVRNGKGAKAPSAPAVPPMQVSVPGAANAEAPNAKIAPGPNDAGKVEGTERQRQIQGVRAADFIAQC